MLNKVLLGILMFFITSSTSYAGCFQTVSYARCTDVTIEYISPSYSNVVHFRTSGDEVALAPFCTAIIGKLVYLKSTHGLRDITFSILFTAFKDKTKVTLSFQRETNGQCSIKEISVGDSNS